MKKSFKLKLTALFLCALMLAPMVLACGEKPASAGSGSATEAAGTVAEEVTAPPEPTPEPTTPEPTTTEAPTTTEPFIPDLSLPYWEQILSELTHYGLTGGTKILGGEDEAELMKKFGMGNGKKEVLDVSEDSSVPFSAAYKVWTTKDMTNFWDANYSCSLAKDIETQQDDLIVGVVWIKGRRTEESDMFMADDEPQYYLAIKTPTDNWATEGDMSPSGIQYAKGEWEKVFFCGRVMNEEEKSSTMNFNMFMGYGIQEFEIGGIIAYLYPSTPDNEKAAIKLVW